MKVKLFILAVLCTTAVVLLPGHTAQANDEDFTVATGCSEQPSYTGSLHLEQGSYDTYAKLSKRGEIASTAVFAQPEGEAYGTCNHLGTKKLSSQEWTKIGTFEARRAGSFVFQLSSLKLAGVPDANRPSVMLVPRTGSVCIPKKECEVTVNGEKGYIHPTGTLLNNSSLHVLRVVDPRHDSIERVLYYNSNRLVYSTKTLEPFDTRYVEYANQPLARVIEYGSGQQVVIKSKASPYHADNFGNFLFRLVRYYPVLSAAIAIIAILLLAVLALNIVLGKLKRRRNERIHRGFIKEKPPGPLARLVYVVRGKVFASVLGTITKVLFIAAGVVVAVLCLNGYVVQIMSVDGHSMERSYYDGDKLLVNKLPKTFADLNGREYVPERGQAVVIHAKFGETAFEASQNEQLLIKRVIALPGERVTVHNGVLTVYNAASPKGFQPDKNSAWQSKMEPATKADSIDITLDRSEIFVSGDNRPASVDSRFNGPLNVREIVGTVGPRVWPIGGR